MNTRLPILDAANVKAGRASELDLRPFQVPKSLEPAGRGGRRLGSWSRRGGRIGPAAPLCTASRPLSALGIHGFANRNWRGASALTGKRYLALPNEASHSLALSSISITDLPQYAPFTVSRQHWLLSSVILVARLFALGRRPSGAEDHPALAPPPPWLLLKANWDSAHSGRRRESDILCKFSGIRHPPRLDFSNLQKFLKTKVQQ